MVAGEPELYRDAYDNACVEKKRTGHENARRVQDYDHKDACLRLPPRPRWIVVLFDVALIEVRECHGGEDNDGNRHCPYRYEHKRRPQGWCDTEPPEDSVEKRLRKH